MTVKKEILVIPTVIVAAGTRNQSRGITVTIEENQSKLSMEEAKELLKQLNEVVYGG